MAGLRLTVVTPEREVLRVEDADIVIAPGVEGQLGILPRHAPLITQLEPGALIARRGGDSSSLIVTGGFLEVMNNEVTVLADASERSDEINLERAQAARERAQREMFEARSSGDDQMLAASRIAMLRALARIRVAEQSRRR